jgi:hypothetical protein
VNKLKFMKIGWTNVPLRLASMTRLPVAWFVPLDRDPGGQGDILLSMILKVRAQAMPPSKRLTIIGCVLAAMALVGNAGLIPSRNWRTSAAVVVVALGIAILFWEPLASWWIRTAERE